VLPAQGASGVLVKPALKLADGHEPAAAATDDAELGEDVVVEEVAADAERCGGFGGGESEPRDRGGGGVQLAPSSTLKGLGLTASLSWLNQWGGWSCAQRDGVALVA